jgi:hypothetical protein
MKILRAGQWIGNGKLRYGLTWDKTTRSRRANPETTPVVRRIFEDAAEFRSPREIADRLTADAIPTPGGCREWIGQAIRRIAREKTYMGVCVARRRMPIDVRRANGTKRDKPRPDDQQVLLTDARTEILIPPDLWHRANAALDRTGGYKKGPARKSNPDFLLAGIIWCDRCGTRMSPGTRDGIRFYRCGGACRNRKAHTGCNAKIGALWVEDKAWRTAVTVILQPGILERELARLRRSMTMTNTRGTSTSPRHVARRSTRRRRTWWIVRPRPPTRSSCYLRSSPR